MNIAILIPSLAVGGAERAASVIGSNFQEEGHNVYYFLFVNSERRFYNPKGEIINSHIFSPFYNDLSSNFPKIGKAVDV